MQEQRFLYMYYLIAIIQKCSTTGWQKKSHSLIRAGDS